MAIYNNDAVTVTKNHLTLYSKHYPITNIVSHEKTLVFTYVFDWRRTLKQFLIALVVVTIPTLAGLYYAHTKEMYWLNQTAVAYWYWIIIAMLVVTALITRWRYRDAEKKFSWAGIPPTEFKKYKYLHHRLDFNTNGSETGSYIANESTINAVQKALMKAIGNQK